MLFYKMPFYAMGTMCVLEFYSTSPDNAVTTATKLIDEVRRIEGKYSRYKPDSFLSEINRAAAVGGSITVDDETASLIDYAFECYRLSDGLFDITSGSLRKVWDFRSGKLPDKKSVEALLPFIGLDKIKWEKPILSFPVKGMEIDFGGICKEYAADLAASLYPETGVHHGLVELGGDVSVYAPKPDGTAWDIDLCNPLSPDENIGILKIKRGGITFSGNTERKITKGGKRYGHILNPKTGWPVEGVCAVSVFHNHCMIAGSYSTIGMLKGADGPAWLKAQGVQFLSVDENGVITNELGELLLQNASAP